MATLTVPIQIDVEHAKEIYQQGYQQGRADAIEEIKQIIHNIYTQDLYCMEDLCEKEKYGHECEDCLYRSIRQNLEQLTDQKEQ